MSTLENMTLKKRNKQEKHKDLNYYMRLKWAYTIEEDLCDKTVYYIIRVNELPGICTDETSIEEGMKNIKEDMKAAFKLYLSRRESIPEPINEKDFPGKIAYRTGSTRHYLLAKEAQKQGTYS
ncbi:MAG: toxin-antitoxin system HicB family antitoxin [Chlamydiales bacterium]|nr:toxin-antitoxin system HicB family antitoxin [Chlamydiales bacterium]